MIRTKPIPKFLIAFSFILVAIILTTQSFAQTAGDAFKGIGNNKEPIEIEADTVEIVNDIFRASLMGNVTISQGNAIVRAQKVDIYYLPEEQRKLTETGIREIIASGVVAIKSGNNHATGDRLEIDFLSDTAILSGKEILLSQESNVIKGCQLTIELTTGNSNFGKCRTSLVAMPNSN